MICQTTCAAHSSLPEHNRVYKTQADMQVASWGPLDSAPAEHCERFTWQKDAQGQRHQTQVNKVAIADAAKAWGAIHLQSDVSIFQSGHLAV